MRVFDAPEPRAGRASTSRVVPARVIAYPRARTARDSDASSASSSSGEDVSDDDEEETGTLWSSSYYSESGSDEESVEKVVVPPVVTLLTESPTETLLCIRGRCVAVDAPANT